MFSFKEYELLGFRVSNNKKKKYDAILRNKETKDFKYVSFGSRDAGQYYDQLEHYKQKNNLDLERRRLYRLRHQHDDLKSYSPGYFSWTYLW